MKLIPKKVPLDNSLVEYKNNNKFAVSEVYLDGKLKKAELVDEDKSFGIFMHSLVLSNYAEVMKVNDGINIIGDEFEKAIFHYAKLKGFDKDLIESIAPKVDIDIVRDENLKVSAHMINENVRIISKGTPDQLLSRCAYILMDSKFLKITRRVYREVNGILNDMIKRCQGVYAIAIKDMSKIPKSFCGDIYVNDMTLVALVGVGSI